SARRTNCEIALLDLTDRDMLLQPIEAEIRALRSQANGIGRDLPGWIAGRINNNVNAAAADQPRHFLFEVLLVRDDRGISSELQAEPEPCATTREASQDDEGRATRFGGEHTAQPLLARAEHQHGLAGTRTAVEAGPLHAIAERNRK